jgi:lysophospholipase L1-like esterase
MKTRYINYLLLLTTLILWKCEPNVDEFQPSAGNADFSVFVSIGDSYSAGYTDGALSAYGQNYGFTNIIAKQLKTVGAGDFKQPMIPEGMSVGSTGNGSYVLAKVGDMLMPVPTEGNPELFLPENWINGEGPFNNVAVPGAKSFHLVTPKFGDPTLGRGNYNPFYTRFASAPGQSTVLGDAMLNNPKFFSLWIGGNDVLWYGLSGGTGKIGIGPYDITPNVVFKNSIDYVVSTLTSGGAKGVMCNIPGIDALPYFSYISYDNLILTEQEAQMLNFGYKEYNKKAEQLGLPLIEFKEGPNAFVIADDSNPLGMRQMVEGEKILLSALSGILGDEHWGSMSPLPDNQSLDLQEIDILTNATNEFNDILKSTAEANGLAFVDANSVMEQLITGIIIDGLPYSTKFVSGGFFSLDGIHASPRGCAIIANAFIEAINKKYGSTVPLATVNRYPGIEFP